MTLENRVHVLERAVGSIVRLTLLIDPPTNVEATAALQ